LLGVQHYGRPLRTDPDQGEGFSYRVFPVGFLSTGVQPGAAPARPAGLQPDSVPGAGAALGAPAQVLAPPNMAAAVTQALTNPKVPEKVVNEKVVNAVVNQAINPDVAFDATRSIRNFTVPPQIAAPFTAGIRMKVDDSITAVPLIQVKVRVVEVNRDHQLDVASVLDYVRRIPTTAPASLIQFDPVALSLNNGGKTAGLTGAQRFSNPGLIALGGTSGSLSLSGQGLLVNLTTEHINWLASFLQSEFHADLLTAPEATTLHDQNVEFFSGSKQPFTLGQNVITGETNNVQQFFYKHVGTYISITPHIVNWPNHGAATDDPKAERSSCDDCKRWKPQNCTIDLSIVVRLSDTGTQTLTNEGKLNDTNFENNIRAISNVVQVKSGEGIVMGGLISELDQKTVSKVPGLGDIPVVGFLFRSKENKRSKVETLIFVEARVLDPDPCVARQQTYEDFLLGTPFVAGNFLSNPLEEGMERTGFGTYLPPLCPAESRYWERLCRKVKMVATKLDDITE
jgi:Flp pilus assembly secretin CpaC